jgi:hypothetical protein
MKVITGQLAQGYQRAIEHVDIENLLSGCLKRRVEVFSSTVNSVFHFQLNPGESMETLKRMVVGGVDIDYLRDINQANIKDVASSCLKREVEIYGPTANGIFCILLKQDELIDAAQVSLRRAFSCKHLNKVQVFNSPINFSIFIPRRENNVQGVANA